MSDAELRINITADSNAVGILEKMRRSSKTSSPQAEAELDRLAKAIAKAEMEIDALVYALYLPAALLGAREETATWQGGLTSDEIKIIGEASHEKFGRWDHPVFKTSMKASCGMLTLPMAFIRFFPSFCFSQSLRLRVMSPP